MATENSNTNKMDDDDPPPPVPENELKHPAPDPAPVAAPGVKPVMAGPKPTNMTCPSCGAEIVTRIEPKASTKTHIVAGVLCLLFGLLCVWVPYCVNTCKNADHFCPNCDAYIGSYSR